MSLLHSLTQLVVSQDPSTVGSGRLQGGWGYVWVSYAVAWGSIALYAVSLWYRRRVAEQLDKESR